MTTKSSCATWFLNVWSKCANLACLQDLRTVCADLRSKFQQDSFFGTFEGPGIYIHVYILVYIIEFMDSMNQMVQMKVMKGQTGWGPIYWLTGLLRFRLVVQEWRTAIYELANESRGRGPGGEGPCHGHGHGCRHRVICCAKNLSTLSQLWVPCSPCSDGIVMVLYMLTFKSITKNIYMTQI